MVLRHEIILRYYCYYNNVKVHRSDVMTILLLLLYYKCARRTFRGRAVIYGIMCYYAYDYYCVRD